MPVTFNSNNNYDVEIITETNVTNPTIVQYSATTNTPFVEIKITPTNSQTNPVLASNIKIDDIVPDFAWNAGVNYNVKGICEPPPPPHSANSSLQHVTGIGVTSNCQTLGFNSFYGNSNLPQQGPYSAQNDFATQTNQIAANGVSWSEIVLIEVYEEDIFGDLMNDNHSPTVAENYNEWLMWNGPVSTPGGLRREVTAKIYPVYVKAFVYLSFDSNGLAGLTANTTLNLDIDEVQPTYGCTDPSSPDHDPAATVDDGSCTFAPIPRTIYIQDSEIVHSGPLTGYTDPPFPSQVPSDDGFSPGTLDLSGQPNMPKNLKLSPNNQPLANTYMPGDYVYEIVSLVVTPRSEDVITTNFQTINGVQVPIIESAYAAFDFPLPNGPDNQDMTDPQSFLGDAVNNLTAAGLYIENISTTTGSAIGRNAYVANGTSGLNSSNTSQQPNWMPDAGFTDEDGLYPKTICDWGVNDIEFIQPDGTIFIADIDGLWVEEQYMSGSPLVPGLEWFPLRLNMYMIVEFTMPNHDVYLNLDLRHDTQRLAQN